MEPSFPSPLSTAEDASEHDDWCLFDDANEDVVLVNEASTDANDPHDQLLNITENETNDHHHHELLLRWDMPSQLHPAVSLGMQRVSSCYFSIQSHQSNSNNSLVDLYQQPSQSDGEDEDVSQRSRPSRHDPNYTTTIDHHDDNVGLHGSGVFYHEFLMEVFTFLTAKDLVAFSETARRPNFEVFYFLQLQLQQALLVEPVTTVMGEETTDESQGKGRHEIVDSSSSLSAIAGCSIVSRLARLDLNGAKEIVNEFLASNSTLRTLPLSYSLAYIRHYLMRHGGSGVHQLFLQAMMQGPGKSGTKDSSREHSEQQSSTKTPWASSSSSSQQTLARAALFVTVVGAASLMGGVAAGVDVESLSLGTDTMLQSLLVRVGVFGSLMMGGAATATAARQMTDTEEKRGAMKDRAEGMARSADPMMTKSAVMTTPKVPSLFEMRQMLQAAVFSLAEQQEQYRPMVLSNPYDHLPTSQQRPAECGVEATTDEKKVEEDVPTIDVTTSSTQAAATVTDRKMPSGCVGAYSRAIQKATDCIVDSIKDSRTERFEALSADDQRQRSLDLLAACSSNDTLDQVKDIIARGIDANAFFVGNEGSDTCALHTAAFNGADKIVDFLCTGISDDTEAGLADVSDGGLCDVNLRDANGWTALHFAAGANSVPVVKTLVKHGAKQAEQAHNGYTPLQWAKRLSNHEVANELTNIAGDNHGVWMSGQPLTSIAIRFLALIPSN